MKIISKTQPSERLITAEFTQSEWNELTSCLGATSTTERKSYLRDRDINTQVSLRCELYNFMMNEFHN